jgi:hypothetical protein
MTFNEATSAIDALMPYLMGQQPPIFEGGDAEFSAWINSTYGITVGNDYLITVTPRLENGLAAVAASVADGAFVFVFRSDVARRTLDVYALVMGPYAQNMVITANALTAMDKGMTKAVMDVLKRSVLQDVTLGLIYEVH